MAPAIRTRREVARWITVQTAYTVALILPATALAYSLWLGGDFSQMISAREAVGFALCMEFAEALLFTPIVAIRSVETLRQLNLARDALDRLADVDPLTGLLNRRGFEKAAVEFANEVGRRAISAAAIVCDVDEFKHVNDAFGHDFGDAALLRLANELRVAASDRRFALGRLGGDEFVVLMFGLARQEAITIAEGVRVAMTAKPVEANGARAVLTISVGLAATTLWNGEVSTLVAAADAALYQAKREGRNRVVTTREPVRAAA